MDRERWQKVKRILEEARELPRAERDEYSKVACGDDGSQPVNVRMKRGNKRNKQK